MCCMSHQAINFQEVEIAQSCNCIIMMISKRFSNRNEIVSVKTKFLGHLLYLLVAVAFDVRYLANTNTDRRR